MAAQSARTKPAKDAGPKAWWAKPRAEDAGWGRFAEL